MADNADGEKYGEKYGEKWWNERTPLWVVVLLVFFASLIAGIMERVF